MIKIVAKAHLKPGCKEKFVELARPLVAASQAEEGCAFYNLHEDTKDPNRVAFIEGWKDKEAIAIHNKTEHFTTICPQFDELLEEPMDVALFTVLL